MKVKELMTTNPRTCAPDTTLAAAGQLMWDGDCGILPVVTAGKLVGVVTDRDMYIALATQNKQPSQLTVGAVATRTVSTCEPEDHVSTALATMKAARVRRLPVVGFGGSVLGILSMNRDVRSRIEEAFKRSAEIDARRVNIAVMDGKVTLSGNVHSLAEREEAKRAAWAAPGVTAVDDRLAVVP